MLEGELTTLANVLLAGSLEGDFGANDADKDAHALVKTDFVLVPLHGLSRPRDHIVSLLKEQRNAVGKPEDVQLILLNSRVLAPNAHGSLRQELCQSVTQSINSS